MKHLRLYEEFDDTILKNYFVYCYQYSKNKSNNDISQLEILKKTKVENVFHKSIWNIVELFYEYGKFRKVDEEDENKPSWISEDSEEILFTSNSLEECKEFIISLTSANKYNL